MPDDRDQGDHWDFLAADLGASPPQEESAKENEPESPADEVDADVVEDSPNESPSEDVAETSAEQVSETAQKEEPSRRKRGQKGDRVVSGFGYRRGSVDWANLARELGVEAMEEAPAPIPAADAPGESESFTVFHVEPTEDESEPIIEAEAVDDLADSEEPLPFADESEPVVGSFGAGILDDLIPDPVDVVPVDVAADAPEETAEPEGPQDEPKGRRRRRRRKPRKQDAEREQRVEEAPTVVDDSETDAEPATDEKQEQEEKPRRRGRRRGGHKRAPREEVTNESDDFGTGIVSDVDDEASTEEYEVYEAEDDVEETEEVESTGKRGRRGERSKDKPQVKKSSKKVTHRGIPCWDEAVGHIIDSNMEDRAKNPDTGGSRHRSGRRRGGDRSGNRGRS